MTLPVAQEHAGGAGRGLLAPAPPADPRPHFARPGARRHRGTARAARGAVTAETAVVLPVLVAVTLGLVWGVSLAVAQVRIVDAAREAARAAARDESLAEAVRVASRVAPSGAKVVVVREQDTVRARVSARVAGPGGVFDLLPGVELDAEAVAARELS